MPRLEMDLDPIVKMYDQLDLQILNPVTAAGVAAIAGVDSVGMTYAEGKAQYARMIMSTAGTRMNWRIPVDDEAVEAVMSNPPDRVTFIDPRQERGCLDLRRSESLEEIFRKIRPVKSLEIAVRITGDVKQLKEAYKMGANAVELDVSDFTAAESGQERLEALEGISGVARVAQKYEVGLLVIGGLTTDAIQDMLELDMVDTFAVGRSVIGKALYVGLENALRDYLFLVK